MIWLKLAHLKCDGRVHQVITRTCPQNQRFKNLAGSSADQHINISTTFWSLSFVPSPVLRVWKPVTLPLPFVLDSLKMADGRGLPLLSGPPPSPSSSSRAEIACRKCSKEFNVIFTRSRKCNHCGTSAAPVVMRHSSLISAATFRIFILQ
jgi:hypothetical protein